MAVPLRVGVTPDRADAQPGEALALSVSVRNTSDVVEHYGLDLLGLPENTGARVEPDVIKLRPGETGQAAVRLTLGTDPPATAGLYTVGVLVRSKYRDDISRCEELPITVATVQQIGLRVEPDVATGKRSAKYQVHVVNAGNVPVRLLLAATDPERRVRSRFDPPMVGLPAGGAASVGLAVRAPVPWNRETQRALKLEAGGDGAYGAVPATFLQRPRFASRLAKVAGALGALGVLVGAILGAALIVKQKPWVNPPPVAATPNEPATVVPSAVGPTQASSPGATAPSSAGAASSAAPSSAAAAGGLREVDLTRSGAGIVPSDAFVAQGLILSGSPVPGGDAACADATAVAVRGTDPATRYLAASLPDKADACNATPVMIRFQNRAGRVEFTFAGPGDRRLEVSFKDLSKAPVTGSAVSDDGSHGGIDYVIISGVAGPQGGAAPPPAVRTVKFTPLG
jgi:hypothetical protein